MKYVSRMIGALALVGLMPLAPLWAQSKGIGAWRPVKDELGFFSPQAREQADLKVRAIKAEFDKDLFVETLKAPKRPKNIDEKDIAARNRFFDQFAEERFANLNVNGVYVMIIDKPAIIRIEVGNNTKALGYFTEANRTALYEKLKDRLANDKDGALLTGVNYVYDSMKSNHPAVNRKAAVPVGHPNNGGGQVHTSGFNWSPIITIVLVLVGVWVLFAVVRAVFGMAGGGGGVGAPGMGYGGGGGGFFSNFLGGMFGAAAGMWMYNSFFGHGGSSAWGAGANDNGGVDKYTGDPADTSATSGGGDYGADGGGTWDAGDAGDAGGGDVGGGDWGGGGGDWGGGGGDFGGGGGGGDW